MYSFPNDLKQLVESQLALGCYADEDELLRDALRALADERDDVSAVQDAIDQWRAGDAGVPLADAFDGVRKARAAE